MTLKSNYVVGTSFGCLILDEDRVSMLVSKNVLYTTSFAGAAAYSCDHAVLSCVEALLLASATLPCPDL